MNRKKFRRYQRTIRELKSEVARLERENSIWEKDNRELRRRCMEKVVWIDGKEMVALLIEASIKFPKEEAEIYGMYIDGRKVGDKLKMSLFDVLRYWEMTQTKKEMRPDGSVRYSEKMCVVVRKEVAHAFIDAQRGAGGAGGE